MLLILLCLHAVSWVASQAPPPPQNVQVEKGQLTWTPGEPDVTYTVNYRRFNSDKWEALPACIQTPFHSCNISAIGPRDTNDSPENSCVTLRVRAERRGLRSEGVNACSRYGDVCTPPLSILTRPGSLTVFLNDDHELAKEHANNAKHRIYFGREGESPLQKYEDTIDSRTIEDLEEGQRYCVQVAYTVHGDLVEPRSCIQCEVIPASEHVNRTPMIVGLLVGIVVLAIIILTLGYLGFFQTEKIKRCLEPHKYEIPPNLFRGEFEVRPFTPIVERYDDLQISHGNYEPRSALSPPAAAS
ncbi:interferon gamma receptor 2 isoform X1 [Maylandia zebra]|uniref:Interferon gamma receptor 2 n=1 Tax=Maylandia zebra TaxID=106582 RepID=A0A3P9DU97_9CICH|nr:interferon gamma receptor 2 isoform X1 [Maylandia zebra]